MSRLAFICLVAAPEGLAVAGGPSGGACVYGDG